MHFISIRISICFILRKIGKAPSQHVQFFLQSGRRGPALKSMLQKQQMELSRQKLGFDKKGSGNINANVQQHVQLAGSTKLPVLRGIKQCKCMKIVHSWGWYHRMTPGLCELCLQTDAPFFRCQDQGNHQESHDAILQDCCCSVRPRDGCTTETSHPHASHLTCPT